MASALARIATGLGPRDSATSTQMTANLYFMGMDPTTRWMWRNLSNFLQDWLEWLLSELAILYHGLLNPTGTSDGNMHTST